MKAKINNENKAKFFAQYYLQKVFVHPDLSVEPMINKWVFGSDDTHEDFDYEYLLLTPISKISVKEAIEICNNFLREDYKGENNAFKIEQVNHHIEEGLRYQELDYPTYQYLQSKGYALPWMGLSVDQQIEAGWIKLKAN